MKKFTQIIIIIFLVIFFTACSNIKITKKNYSNKLIIPAININHEYNILSIKNEVIGIAMFKEYGRPNLDKTNTIIGGHSGTGEKAIFNNLINLNKYDYIILYYNNIKYKYIVQKVFEVDEKEVKILDNTGENTLTILSCKLNDDKKRIVIQANQI